MEETEERLADLEDQLYALLSLIRSAHRIVMDLNGGAIESANVEAQEVLNDADHLLEMAASRLGDISERFCVGGLITPELIRAGVEAIGQKEKETTREAPAPTSGLDEAKKGIGGVLALLGLIQAAVKTGDADTLLEVMGLDSLLEDAQNKLFRLELALKDAPKDAGKEA